MKICYFGKDMFSLSLKLQWDEPEDNIITKLNVFIVITNLNKKHPANISKTKTKIR